MDFSNIMNPQSVDNETGGIQTTQSSTLRRCIRNKWTWIIFGILIILVITIPITIILIKKETPTTTAKSLTTTEGIDMLMNTTGITLPLTTQIPTCNPNGCRAVIAPLFSSRRSFRTEEFPHCNECPHMYFNGTTLEYSEDWFTMWFVENFIIKNSIGQDCEKNPIKGNRVDCIFKCFFDNTCVAFSRQKNIMDDDKKGECWLKTNITVNQIPDDPEWHTLVFNPTS